MKNGAARTEMAANFHRNIGEALAAIPQQYAGGRFGECLQRLHNAHNSMLLPEMHDGSIMSLSEEVARSEAILVVPILYDESHAVLIETKDLGPRPSRIRHVSRQIGLSEGQSMAMHASVLKHLVKERPFTSLSVGDNDVISPASDVRQVPLNRGIFEYMGRPMLILGQTNFHGESPFTPREQGVLGLFALATAIERHGAISVSRTNILEEVQSQSLVTSVVAYAMHGLGIDARSSPATQFVLPS